jgi:hypothetical protein
MVKGEALSFLAGHFFSIPLMLTCHNKGIEYPNGKPGVSTHWLFL